MRDQVEKFLSEFRNISIKKGVFIWDRPENIMTMTMLQLRTVKVTEILQNLDYRDYCEGPSHQEGNPEAWCFGQTIKGLEVYMKLAIDEKKKRKTAVCISFHQSTKTLSYPLR
jgi:hypothetical protein